MWKPVFSSTYSLQHQASDVIFLSVLISGPEAERMLDHFRNGSFPNVLNLSNSTDLLSGAVSQYCEAKILSIAGWRFVLSDHSISFDHEPFLAIGARG